MGYKDNQDLQGYQDFGKKFADAVCLLVNKNKKPAKPI